MASLSYEETLLVPKLEIRRPQARKLTTQFGPERRAVRWPWLVAATLWLAAVARPIDPPRAVQLASDAQELLRLSATAR